MIRVKLTLNPVPLDAVEGFAQALPQTVQQVGKPILDKMVGPLLAELQHYPAKPNYPIGKFPWKTERQRRFVMAKLNGKRYRRKFGLRKAWRVQVKPVDNSLALIIKNEADSAQFVVGRFNQRSRDKAVMPIQPFHAPRWKPAVDTVAPYFARADAEFAEAMTQQFNDALRVNATRRSRFI